MDNCIEPVVTNNAEPKKMGRAASYNQMVLLKDSRRRKIKSYTLQNLQNDQNMDFFLRSQKQFYCDLNKNKSTSHLQDIINPFVKNPPFSYTPKISESCCFITFLRNIQKGHRPEKPLRRICFSKNTKKLLLNFVNLFFISSGQKLFLFGCYKNKEEHKEENHVTD